MLHAGVYFLEHPMTKPTLLQTGPILPIVDKGLLRDFDVTMLAPAGAAREAQFKEIGPKMVAIATGSLTGIKCDAAFLSHFPKIKIVGNFGVGYDSVDADYCAKHNVVLTNTPDVLTEEVADTALGLMIMTVREFGQAERYLRAGRWGKEGDYPLTPGSLRDRTLGMVGMGRIGQAIAKRASAFGMPIVYYSRSKKADVPYNYYGNLVEMARAVDILTVITPGGAETKNLINGDVLKALGPNGILINMARGSVVDEAAVLAALKNKTILSAGLDVFLNEPKINPEFFGIENATLLPHLGSASQYTRDGMGQMVVDNLVAFAKGKPPISPVPETPFKGW